jgi:CubicO group peptidase (beta-lactamase class C family)
VKASVKDTVRDLRYLALTAEPRTKFQYCNLMFVAASHVVESLTGQWLGEFLRQRIWEPLGMKSTVSFPLGHLPEAN